MQTSRAVPPSSVADVLALLLRDPGRPRITWYGGDGERVELSGAVLVNWVSKTTNLLVEELDAAPGTRVLLDLPPHWRALVWALAVWRTGACVVVGSQDAVDVVVTPQPQQAGPGVTVVGVALPALARTFGPDLPPDAVDGTAVLSYGDVIGWAPPTEPSAPALLAGGTPVPHAALLAAPPAGAASRVALAANDLRTVLVQCLAVWASDGSVVLVDEPTAAELRRDAARRARVLDPEQVTVDHLGDASPA